MRYVHFRFHPGSGSAIVLLSLAVLTGASFAQTEETQTRKLNPTFDLLYAFTGGSDGYNPQSGVVFDKNGALYGTTFFGGTVNAQCSPGCGTVFQLVPAESGPWNLNTIHTFVGYPTDVGHSYAHVTFDTIGNLYGTAGYGGQNCLGSCGGIFKLSSVNGAWQESVIYNFGKHTGSNPNAALTLHKGIFYGSTSFGPQSRHSVGYGTVFAQRPGNHGPATHHIIHIFTGGTDGYEPSSDLVFDKHGNAYGSTPYGGTNGNGDIFELIPDGNGNWKEEVIYSFSAVSSAYPSTLILDSQGNLYGATSGGGQTQGQDCRIYGCGVVFELKHNNTTWQEIDLYEFAGGADGYSPGAGLVFDKQGNLYGTTLLGGTGTCEFFSSPGCGTVFELSPVGDGTWQKTTLYNFTGGADGEFPTDGRLVRDNQGRLYGTTLGGATYDSSGYGTVYRLTP